MSLWLCLRFEQLPLQCLTQEEDTPAVVLAARTAAKLDAAEQEIKELGLGTRVLKMTTCFMMRHE